MQLCTNKFGYIEIELHIMLVGVYVASQVTFAPISIRHSNKLHNFTARLRDLQKHVPFSCTKELQFLQCIFHSNMIKGLCGKLCIEQIIQYA